MAPGFVLSPCIRMCIPTQVSARVLPTPALIYKKKGAGGRDSLVPLTASNGAWNMLSHQLYQPKQLKSYALAAFPAQEGVPNLEVQKVRPCSDVCCHRSFVQTYACTLSHTLTRTRARARTNARMHTHKKARTFSPTRTHFHATLTHTHTHVRACFSFVQAVVFLG